MLHRVEVNVVNMSSVVLLIPNTVLPKPALPNTPLTSDLAASAQVLVVRYGSGERHLDSLPPPREICVAFRQCPDGMHMVRKHHPRIDMKRHQVTNPVYGRTEQINLRDEKIGFAVVQGDSKEIAAAGDTISSVVGHGGMAIRYYSAVL